MSQELWKFWAVGSIVISLSTDKRLLQGSQSYSTTVEV